MWPVNLLNVTTGTGYIKPECNSQHDHIHFCDMSENSDQQNDDMEYSDWSHYKHYEIVLLAINAENRFMRIPTDST